MTRQEHQRSREGLLHAEKVEALRPSLEDAYRSSVDSDDRLDSLDLNADDKSRLSKRGKWSKWSWIPTHPPWSSGYTYQHSQRKGQPTPPRRRGLQRWMLPRKTCFLVTLILALGLLAVIGSGALWVYKSAPVDGVRTFGLLQHRAKQKADLNALAIAVMVPNTSRRYDQIMGRKLQKGRGFGQENELGRKGQHNNRDGLVAGSLRRQYSASE